eukprot:CAMPEP_0174895374 /NCGR_PEP_ID=MMETSP0167-20121228/9802_1 /TAXON_ID=38298 /ORGANISM="Rhodella maculata, Strain CCMP736" /LENGTH=492 /DNA_ID=CAMNT_0016134691 /DNA_START=46 /DNA_END=1524 /DNA_ORIENTATION=+
MDPSRYVPSTAFNTRYQTTNTGAPVRNNTSSLTLGPRGPVLLEDYHLIEKLAQFGHERIPERVVHARGAAAKGFFECTRAMGDVTCAKPFEGAGKRTPVAVRFSTVVHSRHSPETLRDPRGFAVKFYTEEGNWDLVGNNFPVFFIRDGIQFPDMVHAFKPNPRTEDQEMWRILDFLSHHPESCHMLTFLLDDVGIPKTYRHMKGAGVHTFRFMAACGKETYVKFHWLPKAGEESLLDDDAVMVGGKDFSHATHDLIKSIDAGNFPEWTLAVQLMDPAMENDLDFDPLDVTKVWPEEQFPMVECGRLVLDQNVDNQFLENEQIAFSPALVVPGIYPSDDKLLQSRLFAYVETQRYRLGANYLMLPINAPRNRYHNNQYDGPGNFMTRSEEVNYYPSRFDPLPDAPPYPVPTRADPAAPRMKQTIEKENNFAQAGERFRAFDAARQERFVERVAGALESERVTPELKAIWVGYFTECDAGLGARLSQKVRMNKL